MADLSAQPQEDEPRPDCVHHQGRFACSHILAGHFQLFYHHTIQLYQGVIIDNEDANDCDLDNDDDGGGGDGGDDGGDDADDEDDGGDDELEHHHHNHVLSYDHHNHGLSYAHHG